MGDNPTIGKQEVAFPDFEDWQRGLRGFTGLAAYTMRGHAEFVMSSGPTSERISGTLASAELFPLLGVDAAAGRVFGRDDARPGFDQVVVLSDRFWKRAFRSNADIVGERIRLNGAPFLVLGVLPAGWELAEWADVWLPLSRLEPLARQQRQWHLLHVLGRLRPDVPHHRANAELQTVVRQLQDEYPVTNKATGGLLTPLHEDTVESVRPLLPILLAATVLVLLIACANVATMMTTRLMARRQDLLVRLSLGATRLHLLRQLADECLLLASFGGFGGLLLAYGAMGPLRTAAAEFVPRAEHARSIPRPWRSSASLSFSPR